jgi:hypothetical protein
MTTGSGIIRGDRERPDRGRATDQRPRPDSSASASGRSPQRLWSRGVIVGSAKQWDNTGPFDGMIKVSPAPFRFALEHLGQ